MLTRRQVLRLALASTLSSAWPGCAAPPRRGSTRGVVLNDVQGQISATRVARVHRPDSEAALTHLLRDANRRGEPVSIAGARHAMGGQPFAEDACHFDLTALNRLRSLDADRRLVEVEAGASWGRFMDQLAATQPDATPGLGLIQKQTGSDELTIGGALAANAHGRGLTLAPIVQDVESFMLLDAVGRVRQCSRRENAELFALAIGGYGLFGIVTQATLRLQPRYKVRRRVEVVDVAQLIATVEQRIAEGCRYGDYQYAVDPASDDYLMRGVLSCFQPVPDDTLLPERTLELSDEDWAELIYLAHHEPGLAFERYEQLRLATDGQLDWCDNAQRSIYDPHYHEKLDAMTSQTVKATEVLTELYVPRVALASFMRDAATMLRESPVPVVYGNIRFVERDDTTFLPWAPQQRVCVIFNLHCTHTPQGLAQAQEAFRDLIDLAIHYEGSYYLTYHRWARKAQVEQCYPRFPEFLELKRRYDPRERFQSQWYRHYRNMFA